MANKISVVFHNISNYNCHFIIKELAKEFEGQFECLWKNTKKYKTFFVPIEKEVIKINKDGNESIITISYTIKFIDSARFMASSLSNLVDNLAEGIHKIKSKDWFLEYESINDNLIIYKYSPCNKGYWKKLDGKLKKRCFQ